MISKTIDLTNSSNDDDEDMKPAAKDSKTSNVDKETGFVFVENIEGWVYPAKKKKTPDNSMNTNDKNDDDNDDV